MFKMRSFKPLTGITIISALLIFCASAIAAEFTADITHVANGRTVPGKVFIKGEKIRTETMGTVTLIDTEKGTGFVLMPEAQSYMEMHGLAETAGSVTSDERLAKIGTKEEVGTETVSGYECDKIIVTYNDTSKGKSTQWVSKKLKYPLKFVYKNGDLDVQSELTNIKEVNLDDSLFIIPSGYKKINIPGLSSGAPTPK